MGHIEALAPLRASTLRDNVADLLVNAILSAKIKPGERLNESALSRQLHVSRAPIREALQQLQEQGLVVNKPRRGMFVVSLTAEDVFKINSLRIVLEAEAMLQCQARLTPAIQKRILQHLERMERDTQMTALEAMRYDLGFHRLIWSNAGNEYLERTLVSLSAPLFAYALVRKPEAQCARMILDSHRPIYQFVCGELEVNKARDVMREHIGYSWEIAGVHQSLHLV